jgi:carbon storage regulator
VLVLSRKADESVVIGEDIVITVLEVRGDVVRLGIAAPREVKVHRSEVYEELQQANRDAASPAASKVQEFTTRINRGKPSS